MAFHQKAMDTQIARLPSRLATYLDLKDFNTLSAMEEGLEESPVMVLQETVLVPDST